MAGWARPERTLAPFFEIINDDNSPSSFLSHAEEAFKIKVKCISAKPNQYQHHYTSCSIGGSHFYLRAYGPSVITGTYTDHGNGIYTLTFFPVDEGLYTVEVVLTFSQVPSMDSFPLSDEDNQHQPGYEGYLLRGFPRQLHVRDELIHL